MQLLCGVRNPEPKAFFSYVTDLQYAKDFTVTQDVKDAFDENGYLLLRYELILLYFLCVEYTDKSLLLIQLYQTVK